MLALYFLYPSYTHPFEFTNTDVNIEAQNSALILIHSNFVIWMMF
jgi:hypothetical protein